MNRGNKNIALYVTILAFAVTIMAFVFSMFSDDKMNANYMMIVLIVSVIPLIYTYTLLIFKRINPKKYVFFSYSKHDQDLAKEIMQKLEKALNENSRYRYEICIGDDIPLGTDMTTGIKDIIGKSEIVIALISADYLKSPWCIIEFNAFNFETQKIIPIAMSGYQILSELPIDISGIKGLSIGSQYSSHDVSQLVETLARDIIKNQV